MNKKKIFKDNESGFVLLYAVLVTMVVVTVGVLMINIVTRQIVLSSVSKNSQISYYAANAGFECSNYYKLQRVWGVINNIDGFIPPEQNIQVECLGQSKNLNNLASPDYLYEWSFLVDDKSCVDVEISRNSNGDDFNILAKGYNVSTLNSSGKCNISNFSRLTERIISVTE